MTVTVKAYAKLNLFLDITGKLPNGYHTLNTVMQSISLADEITVSASESDKRKIALTAESPLIPIPLNEKNIAWRAAEAFLDKLGKEAFINININKKIPTEAGLGGSSTDGAAVLRALNKIYGSPFTLKELESLGARLGADVPFCVAGGTADCKGTGADIAKLPFIGECAFLIIKPDFACNTTEAYSYYDDFPVPVNENFNNFTAAISKNNFLNVTGKMYNVFEKLYENKPFFSEIEALRKNLLKAGAIGAMLTGSGSAFFGVFTSKNEAEKAFDFLPYPEISKHIAIPIKKT